MKAKDLAKVLLLDPEREVVLSRDSEGNSFSPLGDYSTGACKANTRTPWYVETGLEPEDLTDEMREKGYSEEDVLKDGTPCFILWPTN